jgi:hypothetical protein
MLILNILFASIYYWLIEFGAILRKMELISKSYSKGKKPKKSKKNVLSNLRSLTRKLNPPSKRDLPTIISMSCTNNQY